MKDSKINYIYFLVLFLFLIVLNTFHIFLIDSKYLLSSWYFLISSYGQTCIEMLLLLSVGMFVKKHLHQGFYISFIVVSFLLAITHLLDFFLIRYLDISFWYGIRVGIEESLDNFIEIIHLTGIKVSVWVIGGSFLLFLVSLSGVGIYGITNKLSRLKPWSLSSKNIRKALFALPLGLILFEWMFLPLTDESDHQFLQRALPIKMNFFGFKKKIINLSQPLKALPGELEVDQVMCSVIPSDRHKPNIFLFIVESLREDYIDREIAVHISAFRDEHLSFENAFSSGNGTHLSWYSIFHSNLPFYWNKGNKSGSVPLQFFKKLGYKIHIYSAAQLKYYELDQVIFGKDMALADTLHVYPHYHPKEAWESDAEAIDQLASDIDTFSDEGNVFLVFLDSTHFNYSWPDDYPTHFQPISEQKTQLRVSNSIKDVELIKNRYRNSIHYVDSLFGKVMNHLKAKGSYEDSIIVFTGDHGEEFFEEGQMFHATHLSHMQTEPPLYYKLGDHRGKMSVVTSHMDIFPTLIDYVVGEHPIRDMLHGESVFKKGRWPYVISARYNLGRAPYEFFIHNGKEKMIMRFKEQKEIFRAKALEIINLKDKNDNVLPIENDEIQGHFQKALSHLFSE